MAPGPPWTNPFTVVEVIVHKKYNMKGRDSKVKILTLHPDIQISKSTYGQGRKTERFDYDIAILRLDYPIMDEGTGITVLQVLKSLCPLFPG